ncbi:amino acid ABC transporter substrate-binding protein, PAAT family [Pseudoduganella namucuonensis]|uniref:Amino acid ABC transporter substrate-binding protein, PAAT family n=2 Tax=Pseudoduganella namucuonensis TaxID=1035707 RepID=A0A1I7LBY4_9BURK|nr:amino acid ABC transporter substrate-binding protein, PAAT family [Pseudoduganella namucuonensis]
MRNKALPCLSLLATLALPAALAAPLSLVTAHDPPHNMQTDGRVVGLSTEKVEEMFKRAGVPYTLRFTPWPRAYQSAHDLPGHCAFSMARTKEREDQFQWVGPIAQMDWVLYARAEDKLAPRSLEDVRSALIGGSASDVITQWLVANKFRVDPTPTDSLNPAKLVANRFEYWAVSRQRGVSITAAAGMTGRIVPVLTFGHSDLYLGCHHDLSGDIVLKLNKALAEMRQDGTYERINARYTRWAPPPEAPAQ